MIVAVDDLVLWFNLSKGPGGSLTKMSLAASDKSLPTTDDRCLFFDDVGLYRAVKNQTLRRLDWEQDEIRLTSGDQVLGTISAIDRHTIDLRGSFGQHAFGWHKVRGVYFRRQALPVRTLQGEQVAIGLRPGIGTVEDRLEGVLLALDDRFLALHHPVLGKLDIARERLAWLRFVAEEKH
jgi:hypothetical protein